MKTSELKKRIVESAIKKQESIIGDFRQRVKDVLETEGNVNEEEYDNHQQSFKSESIAEVNLLNDELEFASKELDELRKMEGYGDRVHDCVEYGAVVKTDRKTFFVSASIEDFDSENMRVFGLSVHTPLYKAMKGKKAGQSFSCQGVHYNIEQIF